MAAAPQSTVRIAPRALAPRVRARAPLGSTASPGFGPAAAHNGRLADSYYTPSANAGTGSSTGVPCVSEPLAGFPHLEDAASGR